MIELIENGRDCKIASLLDWLQEFNEVYPIISKENSRHFSYNKNYVNVPPKITIPEKYNDRFEALLKEVYEDVYKEYECLLKEQ